MEQHPDYPSQPISSLAGQPSTDTNYTPPASEPPMLLQRESSRLPPPSDYGSPGYSRDDDDHHLESLPPGFGFHPTDEELLVHYLIKKVRGEPLPENRIADVKLYDHNPETLAASYKKWEEKWYFFTSREKKYPNGSKPKRSAANGYWKPIRKKKPVQSGDGTIVGYKTVLTFFLGTPAKCEKTSWNMHEYLVSENVQRNDNVDPMQLDKWVLCSIYQRDERGRAEENMPQQLQLLIIPETPAIAPTPPPTNIGCRQLC